MSNNKHRSAFVHPSFLRGKVVPPVSKSLAHRRLFCLYLASLNGSRHAMEVLQNTMNMARTNPQKASEDILATCDVIDALVQEKTALACRESGSTLRFAIPVAALSGNEHVFSGKGRLPERPLAEYKTILDGHGVQLDFANEKEGLFLPLTLRGKLEGGEFSVPGNISSQYLTGLLLALPLLAKDSVIRLESPLESASYVVLTLSEQRLFGVEISFDASLGEFGSYVVKGGQTYTMPAHLPKVEADASQAAFFHLANFLGADIDVQGLSTSTKQGDAVFRHLLGDLCHMQEHPKADYVVQECSVEQFPDIVPAFALACAVIPGTHILRNVARLRMKECDRLHATVEMLEALGVEAEEGLDFLLIKGMKKPLGGYKTLANGEKIPLWFKSGEVKTYNDHRMMMCQCIAAAHSIDGLFIDDIDCVKKSYPRFLDDYTSLGGVVELRD